MIQTGILNPDINSLLSRVRHTNTLVIADYSFPFWPDVETVDISLVAGLPRVVDVLTAIRGNFKIGKVVQAEEFLAVNADDIRQAYENALAGVTVIHEPHLELKKRVPSAVGIIRTGETARYGNLILESA
jgi:D-ribose pyranase